MAQAGKVAEIFATAGEAFSKLGALTMALQSGVEHKTDSGTKWGDEEIEMMRTAVKKFGTDVEKISNKIKLKSAAQMKATLKQRALQSANSISSPIKVPIVNTAFSTTGTPIMTLPRPQFQIQNNTRLIGQKSKALPIQMSVRGATPMSTQMTGKKIRLDNSAMNVLTSIAPSPINTLIRQNTPVAIAPAGSVNTGTAIGVPIMASSQGFQVIVPPQKTSISGTSTVVPVSLLAPGVVQRVSNANTSGNVDVES